MPNMIEVDEDNQPTPKVETIINGERESLDTNKYRLYEF